MSLSLFPPSNGSQHRDYKRVRRAKAPRRERALQVAAIEALEQRQLLQGTPTPSFTNAEVLSLANATFVNNGGPAANDRPFPGGLFVTDLSGFDQTHGGIYSDPSKPLSIVFLGRDGLTVINRNTNGTFKPAVVYPVAPLTDPGGLIYDAIYGGSQMPHGFLDLNGDGFPDFVVVESEAQNAGPSETPGSVTVFLGNGNGTFKTEDYSNDVGVNPDAITVADLHITGVKSELDIAVANIGNESVTILNGNGKGQFGANGVLAANEPAALPVGNFPESIVASDVNGDGVPDLLVGNDNSNDPTISVLVNKSANKGSSFVPQFVLHGYSGEVLLAKVGTNAPSIVTGDADILTPDLPLSNSNIPKFTSAVIPGFTEYAETVAEPVQAFTTGQFPGHSKYQDDIAEASYRYSTVTLARGDGTLGFLPGDQIYSTLVQYTPASTATGTQSNSSGTATATGVTTSTYLLGYAPASVATGDILGDGYPAIVTGDYGVRGSGNGYKVDITRPPAITIIPGTGQGTFDAIKQPAIDVGLNGEGAVNPTTGTVGTIGGGAVDQNGFPTGGSVVGSNPYPNAIAVADLNGDGLNDIITAAPGAAPTTASPSNGTTFKLSNQPGIVTALVNNADGVIGSFGVAPESVQISGTTSFIGVSTIDDFYQPVAVAVADLTGDGVPDLIVLNKVNNNTATAGQGATQFDLIQPYLALGGSFVLSGSDSAGAFTTGAIPVDSTPVQIEQALTAAGVRGVSVYESKVQVGLEGDEIVDSVTFSPSDGAATLSALSSLIPNTDTVYTTQVYGGANKYYTGDVVVYQGDGDGTFNPTPLSVTQVGFNPVAMELVPTAGDGAPDLAVVNYGVQYKNDKTHFGAPGSIEVLDSNGGGTFTVGQVIPDAYGPSAIAVGTFGNTVNNTAVYDLAVTNRLDIDHKEGADDTGIFTDAETYGNVQVFLGDGAGNFSEQSETPVGKSPNAIVAGNFNGPNAPLGLAVLNEGEESLTVLRGNGDGTFITQQVFDFPYLPDANLDTNPTPRETDSAPIGIAAGQIEGDGYTDLVVTYAGTNDHPGYSENNPGGKIGVMINEGASSPDGLGDLAAPVQFITAGDQIDSEPFTQVTTYRAVSMIADNVAIANVTGGDGANDVILLNGTQAKYVGTVNVLLNTTVQANSKPAFVQSTVTFSVGVTSSQVVTTTGNPVPTITETNGSPPNGLSISFSNGEATISGDPTATGETDIVLTATNSQGTTIETLAIVVVASSQQSAVVSLSGNTLTTTENIASTFSFIAENFSSTPTFSETGTLPAGLMLVDLGTGTAEIEGTPSTGDSSASPYMITLTATNGINTASLPLTIDVGSGEMFTSATSATFTVGNTGSFQVTTNLSGSPTYTISGTLPAGVTFNTSSGLLSGDPTTITNGEYVYDLTFGVVGNTIAPQNFTLTVDQASAFSSATSDSFSTSTPGTFTFTTTGNPVASTITETGALPSGLAFTNNDDGTAVIAGTPATGTQGTYDLTMTATNGIGAVATESFVLTVSSGTPIFTFSPNHRVLDAAGTSLTDNVNIVVSNGQLVVTYDSLVQDFPITQLKLINLSLGSGATTVFIGAGAPTIDLLGGQGTDTVSSNNGLADTLVGGSGGADSINAGGGGNASLEGSTAGSDTLVAGSGNCTLRAIGGGNSLIGGSGFDSLLGGSVGGDTLIAGGGNNTLKGGTGGFGDSMSGGGGKDNLLGGSGNDTIVAGDGNSTLYTGSGNDQLTGGSGTDLMKATGPGSSTLTGGSGPTSIKAVGGNDELIGGSGPTMLRSGPGIETITAGTGPSTIISMTGSDSIDANNGNNNLIQALSGMDTVIGDLGSSGIDTIFSVTGDLIQAGPRDVLNPA